MQTLSILTNDGARSEAALYEPDQNASDILFLCLPAMGVKAAYYRPLADALTGEGHSVMLCELRGQGTSQSRAPAAKFGYREMVKQDIPAYIKAAKENCPEKDIVLLGHSLGGHLSLLYTAAHPEKVKGIALIASGSVYFRAYPFPQNLKIWFATQSAMLISGLFGYFPGHKIGFGGRQPKTVMSAWARQGRTGRFALKGSNFDYESAMTKITCPVFALSIAGDDFAPHSATDHLVGKLKSARLTRIEYQPSDAIKPKINHFRWVKHSEEIIGSLSDWVERL
ncbi:Putative alpha/beta hydrolase [Litorimonas haliclonae]